MSFDWANYLTLATELRERDGEAELRTVILEVIIFVKTYPLWSEGSRHLLHSVQNAGR